MGEQIISKILHGRQLSIGQKAADSISKWAGSWTFIILFIIVLSTWIMINTHSTNIETWDPYPYILLNFILSFIAAIQAPIILMSQNRQSQKDRNRMQYDYDVNKKSQKGIEQVIRKLEKIEKALKINEKVKKIRNKNK
jgi:uncharacterized membrane protein